MATPQLVKNSNDGSRPGYNGILEWAVDNWKDIAKVGGAAAKSYIDYKDQKRRNEVEQAAYNEYLKQVEAAGQEAQAAVDLNLMPMTVTNVPTTKADVSDFTAVAARGGLMNLPTRQRKRYATRGFVEDDEIEIMDPESLGDFELQKEEGVNIGEQVFHDTGDPMTNAKNVWNSGQINQDDYIDFNEFFQSGDWQDHISKEEVQGDMKMAKGPEEYREFEEEDMMTPETHPSWFSNGELQYMAANGGIIGLRHGGRPGYQFGIGPQQGIMPQGIMPQGMMPQQGLRPGYAEQGWVTKKSDVEEEQLPRMGREAPAAEDILGENQPPEELDISTKVVVSAPDGTMIAISQEDYYKVMNGEMTQEEALENAGWTSGYEKIELDFENLAGGNAKGGLPKRVRKAPGGIMDLGGLEKDYRTTGGFVPIGAYERKDDVPARLSKNEFVMTADAVRAAGGGSINKGAQRMYDTMKHLEASPTAKRMTA
jgi:hypothetical protein